MIRENRVHHQPKTIGIISIPRYPNRIWLLVIRYMKIHVWEAMFGSSSVIPKPSFMHSWKLESITMSAYHTSWLLGESVFSAFDIIINHS